MSKVKKDDIVGKIYGELKVLNYDHTDNKYRSYFNCLCLVCGKEKIIARSSLISGRSKSCGCEIRHNSNKHCMSRSRLYRIYYDMKARCYNVKNTFYYNYGGRGIYM